MEVSSLQRIIISERYREQKKKNGLLLLLPLLLIISLITKYFAEIKIITYHTSVSSLIDTRFLVLRRENIGVGDRALHVQLSLLRKLLVEAVVEPDILSACYLIEC